MRQLRASIRNHPAAILLLVALVLCIKAIVPPGFMIAASPDRTVTVAICADASGGTRQMELAIPAKPGEASGALDDHQGGKCAFSGLAGPALTGAHPILLALVFAVALLLGLAPARSLPFRSAPRLRPPLRGPPASI